MIYGWFLAHPATSVRGNAALPSDFFYVFYSVLYSVLLYAFFFVLFSILFFILYSFSLIHH